MAFRFEDGPMGGVVVDLAVEDQPQSLVLVGHRLIAGEQVDDAQATEAEADVGLDVETVGVRPAVAEGVGHRPERRRLHRFRRRAQIDDAADPTHTFGLTPRSGVTVAPLKTRTSRREDPLCLEGSPPSEITRGRLSGVNVAW